MTEPEVVLLGGPNSGKTHFAGQLYGRLKRAQGELRLHNNGGTPADISALEEVLACLEEGRAATHTSEDTWSEIRLSLVDKNGQSIDLLWPDYGGEQLRTVFKSRASSEAWGARLKSATAWVFLIRLDAVVTYPDALEQLCDPNKGSVAKTDNRINAWDANAYWIELLQILLHIAGHGTVKRLHIPKLAVMLSCYDNLTAGDKQPSAILRERLPLLYSFIQNVWAKDAVSIWGLSALGKHLDDKSADASFIDEGPEKQGWIIAPEGGDRNSDLTKPLNWLLQS
jgi:hypothetical protein